MLRSDGNREGETVGENTSLSVDRRSYLKLAGVAAGSASMLSGAASAAFTRRGIKFKRTVDMVADAGCDPTGNEPCDSKIRNAADDHTLLKFPPGEYKITEKNVILNTTNLGFLGEGDVRFTVPERYNEKMFVVEDGTGLLFENIDVDLRAAGATPGLHFGVDDDLEVHDVEYLGQGIHPNSDPRGGGNGNPAVTYALYPIIRSPDGTGTVSNVVAKNDGLMGAYNHGNGRVGVWIGISHKGTVTLKNCQFEGFPNNGLYCSRTGGAVQVEGGVFRNNDITQVRLSSSDSYVKNAVITADFDNSNSPNPGDTLNSRGVRFEAGKFGYRGASVENCDITIASTPHSSGGVVVGSDGADHAIRNTRIKVDVDSIRGVYAKAPVGFGNRGPPPKPHSTTLENVSVTGSASGADAVRIDQRDDSVVKGCCIDQNGGNRHGVRLVDSDGSKVVNSTIDVNGQRVVEDNTWVRTRNIDASGSCPTPNQGGGRLPHTLTIEGTGSRADYTFTVKGDLEKSTANGADRNDDDTISGQTASGHTSTGLDSYTFSGELVAFDLDGEAAVTLDGQSAHVGQRPDHVLTIEGTGSRADYEFTVSSNLSKSTANGADRNGDDTISGQTASGHTSTGLDSYTFSGELKRFVLDGEATVTVDGEPAHVGQRPDHVLTIEGTGSRADYEFTVSSNLSKSTANGADRNGADTISGQTASGHTSTGLDSYTFSGELERFVLDGEATVTVDGEPAHVGQRSDHVLTIEGTGSRADYEFTVGSDLSKSTANGADRNGHDTISGQTASGHTSTGLDSYTFSGELERFDLDGEATVTLDGEPVDVNQSSDHVLTIEGMGSRANYTFTVGSDLSKSTANGADRNGHDTISGQTASGHTSTGLDSYTFSGELVAFDLDGEATVTLDGKPAHVGQRPDHVLTIEGSGSRADYEFTVENDLAKSTANGADRNSADTISGQTASGHTSTGLDSYTFSGSIKRLNLNGSADVLLDGNRIDPTRY
ncbi:hypothetical protein MUK72_13655 [Halococcus dombrowskii]|nr:hypothetical protein [Halococcus dombrowskii]UOO95000.1 hypothetical protein MUK72_13655 [Halococcus dombrowskii]